jgi:hypothetical protein
MSFIINPFGNQYSKIQSGKEKLFNWFFIKSAI